MYNNKRRSSTEKWLNAVCLELPFNIVKKYIITDGFQSKPFKRDSSRSQEIEFNLNSFATGCGDRDFISAIFSLYRIVALTLLLWNNS